MAKKEKKWFGVTRSPEEDLALVDIILSSRTLTVRRITVIMIMSLLILAVYLIMNQSFSPAYPVVTSFAEKDEIFTEHYPPFRMFEWANYSVTREIIDGRMYRPGTFSRSMPVGYPLVAAPLTAKWGERGMYLTNVFILWISSLVFFFLMLELVEYPLAIASTLVLALATPNIFYASSAFPEPTAQLFLVLSVFLFVKGIMANREWLYYGLCGVSTGLLLFLKPSLSLTIVLFAGLLVNERGKISANDRNLISLAVGFLLPLTAFLLVNRFSLGSLGAGFFTGAECKYDLSRQDVFGEGGNIITGLWKLLFDSPNGLVFLMPMVTIVPMGIIVMWRNELHTITLIVGLLLLYVVVFTAIGPCPVTGEGLGSRQLVPILPFIVIPLAFIWREQAGEKIWLVSALVLTVYMSTFGWWTGIERGGGFFIGALHDRNARSIILARKDMIGRPRFESSNELAALYVASLKEKDFHLWLQCLDKDVLDEINGFERIVFAELTRNMSRNEENVDYTRYIDTVDPNRGVRPVLPSFESAIQQSPE